MSADLLRRAAGELADAAEKASTQTQTAARVTGVWLNSRFHVALNAEATKALADWLGEAADHLEDQSDFPAEHVCPTALEGLECSVLGQSLTFARAYLGESP